MKKQFVAILYVMLFVLAGCSDPKEVIVPLSKDAASDDFKAAVEKLTEEEQQLVKAYVVRTVFTHGMAGTQAPSVTIAKALEEQRAFKAEQEAKEAEEARLEAERKAEEERMQAEALAKVKRMREMADVYLVNKEFIPSNYRAGRYQDYVQITCNVKNNYTEAMSGLKGSLVINNSFGDHIFTITMTVEEAIPANSTVEWVGSMEYNQFMSEHKALANAELGKIKTVWIPEAYILHTGEVIE